MSAKQSSPDRRTVLASSAAMDASSLIPKRAHAGTTSDTIRPFHIAVPDSELDELRRRARKRSAERVAHHPLPWVKLEHQLDPRVVEIDEAALARAADVRHG